MPLPDRKSTLSARETASSPVVYFDDYVYDGDLVEVDGVGPRICYLDPSGPEWFLRPLNKRERAALIDRVMKRVT